jgi:hypothetical protein
MRSAGTDGAAGRLQRTIGEARRHVRPAVGTQGGALTALQARPEIVHSQLKDKFALFVQDSIDPVSEWLGTASTVALSNTYHPDYQRGFAPAAERVGYNILQDMGFDVLREFWPGVSRKFKLPFRGEPDLVSHDPNPATKQALAALQAGS